VDELLRLALEPVLRDARVTGAPHVRVLESGWSDDPDMACVVLRGHGGSTQTVSIRMDEPEPLRLLRATEGVQEWIIEELWPDSPTNWPPCPHHPDTHPLEPLQREGDVVWTCPKDAITVAAVGELL
jgi:hypothetical protein